MTNLKILFQKRCWDKEPRLLRLHLASRTNWLNWKTKMFKLDHQKTQKLYLIWRILHEEAAEQQSTNPGTKLETWNEECVFVDSWYGENKLKYLRENNSKIIAIEWWWIKGLKTVRLVLPFFAIKNSDLLSICFTKIFCNNTNLITIFWFRIHWEWWCCKFAKNKFSKFAFSV